MSLQQQMWSTEDYELALSYLPLVAPEGDLFDGLGSVQEADALARKTGLEIEYDGRAPAPEAELPKAAVTTEPTESAEPTEPTEPTESAEPKDD